MLPFSSLLKAGNAAAQLAHSNFTSKMQSSSLRLGKEAVQFDIFALNEQVTACTGFTSEAAALEALRLVKIAQTSPAFFPVGGETWQQLALRLLGAQTSTDDRWQRQQAERARMYRSGPPDTAARGALGALSGLDAMPFYAGASADAAGAAAPSYGMGAALALGAAPDQCHGCGGYGHFKSVCPTVGGQQTARRSAPSSAFSRGPRGGGGGGGAPAASYAASHAMPPPAALPPREQHHGEQRGAPPPRGPPHPAYRGDGRRG